MSFWDRTMVVMVGIAIAIAVALAILLPLVLIWALNTLFHTNIEMTFWTWLAMFAGLAMFVLLFIISLLINSGRSECD